jgi:DNA-binding beta-propeller fold protein YncE
LFDETQGIVSDNYFKLKNPDAVLGSVPQSITKIGINYFLVVNNTNKIIVLDSNFVKITEINNLLSPRYVLALPNNKAYVTDLKANAIHIINTQTFAKIGTIPCAGWTEKMILIGSLAYITNYNKSILYVVDINTDAIADSIAITKGAEAIEKDKNNNIWVMCTSVYNTEHKYIYNINPSTKTIIKTFEFAINAAPSKMCINNAGNCLYYINKHVYKLGIDDATLPTNFVIDGSAPKILYGLAIQPSNENIYVSDSKAGQSISKIFVYKNTGETITNFDAGYFAGNFFFDK